MLEQCDFLPGRRGNLRLCFLLHDHTLHSSKSSLDQRLQMPPQSQIKASLFGGSLALAFFLVGVIDVVHFNQEEQEINSDHNTTER